MPNSINLLFQQFRQILDTQLVNLGTFGSINISSVILSTLFVCAFVALRRRFNSWAAKALSRSKLEKRTKREALLISKYALYPIGAFILLRLIGIDRWLFKELGELQSDIRAVIDLNLFTIGKTQLTLWTVIYLLTLSWLLVRLTGQCETWFINRILSRTKLERGMIKALAALFRYAVVTIGMIVIIQSAGIDLSALTIMAGGLAVAIGLALQSIMNNLISGLVILFERPIKVGDRIDVGGITGDVSHVSLRATTIITNDNIAIIVPNSEFITSKVVNWTYSGRECRFSFPFKVAADSDPKLVKELLLQIAEEDKGILADPEPKVLFDERGESSLSFSLSVWSREYVTHPSDLRSNLNFAVSQKLQQHGVMMQSTQKDETKHANKSGGMELTSFHPPTSESENGKVKILQARS